MSEKTDGKKGGEVAITYLVSLHRQTTKCNTGDNSWSRYFMSKQSANDGFFVRADPTSNFATSLAFTSQQLKS